MAVGFTRPVPTILVTRDERWARDVDSNLMEAATVDVLRACACAADVVLIPATIGMVPVAAVIANDLRHLHSERGDEARERQEQPWPLPARFVPIEWGQASDDRERIQPFLRADLGGSVLDPIGGHQVLPAKMALAQHPPGLVVALTGDDVTLGLLRTFERRPRVCYFRSLMREPRVSVLAELPIELIDLERRMPRVEGFDEESGRSDDAGLEPFIPFGVLLQYQLWSGRQ